MQTLFSYSIPLHQIGESCRLTDSQLSCSSPWSSEFLLFPLYLMRAEERLGMTGVYLRPSLYLDLPGGHFYVLQLTV